MIRFLKRLFGSKKNEFDTEFKLITYNESKTYAYEIVVGTKLPSDMPTMYANSVRSQRICDLATQSISHIKSTCRVEYEQRNGVYFERWFNDDDILIAVFRNDNNGFINLLNENGDVFACCLIDFVGGVKYYHSVTVHTSESFDTSLIWYINNTTFRKTLNIESIRANN